MRFTSTYVLYYLWVNLVANSLAENAPCFHHSHHGNSANTRTGEVIPNATSLVWTAKFSSALHGNKVRGLLKSRKFVYVIGFSNTHCFLLPRYVDYSLCMLYCLASWTEQNERNERNVSKSKARPCFLLFSTTKVFHVMSCEDSASVLNHHFWKALCEYRFWKHWICCMCFCKVWTSFCVNCLYTQYELY